MSKPRLIRAVRYRELRDAAMRCARSYPHAAMVWRRHWVEIARVANRRLVQRLQIAHGKRAMQ